MVEYRLSSRWRLLRFVLLLSTALTPAAALAQSSSFEALGQAGDLGGSGYAVSADGSAVAGYYRDATDNRPYLWSGGVRTDLGITGIAYGISADGSVVVGQSLNATFSWTGGVVTYLATLPGASNSSANAASADGSVIAGLSDSAGSGLRAVRWVGGAITDLGTLGGNFSRADGISADGSVVVGYSSTSGPEFHAFRWVGGVMTDLGTLGGTLSVATGVSADGNVVVGRSATVGNATQHAFRWVGGVMSDLGALAGDDVSFAFAANANGSVVVGFSAGTVNGVQQQRAFRWAADTGMQSVAALLQSAGINLGGIQLVSARGVSADGNVITGAATVPNAFSQAYVARLGSGLIMMPDQMNSFASLGSVGQTATASLGTNFATATNQATQAGTSNASGKPFSVFSAMGYDSDPTVSGTLGGTAKLNDRGLIVGATFGADNIRTTNMHDGGSAKMNAGTFGLFVAQVPEAGWQGLIGANAIYLNGNISRGYLNGVSPVTSTGATHGTGYGLAGRIGYTFAGVLPKTQVTPFASYNYTHISFAGYTEADGPFPAVMNSFRDMQQVSRVGADARYTLSKDTWLWGTLAWGHRLDAGKSSDVSGTLIGLFPIATTGGTTTRRDWAEVTGGVRYGAWTNGAVTASLTANLPDRGVVNYVASLGVSQSF